MAVSAATNVGLDASVTQGFIKSIKELEGKRSYAMSRVSTLALPNLAALDGLRHSGKALVGVPMSLIVAGGRMVGLNLAKNSDYNVRKEALHVVRALAYFASAVGHAAILLSLAFLVKPTLVEKVNSALGLNTPWEKVSKAANFQQRAMQKVTQSWAGTKKFVNLVISNKDPKLTRKVVGAGLGLAAVGIGLAWKLSGTAPKVDDDNQGNGFGLRLNVSPDDLKPADTFLSGAVITALVSAIVISVGVYCCWPKRAPRHARELMNKARDNT